MTNFRKIKRSSNPKKETAWKWFSKYIRLRDAIKTTGDEFFCKCITCGKIYPMNTGEVHAGHAIGGRMNAVLFNEDLVHGQCKYCNDTGQYEMYKHIMIERYGQEKWDYWQSTKNDLVRYTDFDYESIAKIYREKIKQLKMGL